MQKITPFWWFDTQAEEAAKFYVSIFKNAKINGTTYYSEEGPGPKGSVMTVGFELDGQKFIALNGGPMFKFNESVSFVVNCETQQEIDHYWEKLSSAGGQEVECGWVKDKYGLSWQVVPAVFWEWTEAGDAAAMNRVMHALMQMKKLDLATLQRAHDGK
jgi:predicted 3-demethylubiquinone-9 3-methyltransferase (glyoxalase superfamily)